MIRKSLDSRLKELHPEAPSLTPGGEEESLTRNHYLFDITCTEKQMDLVRQNLRKFRIQFNIREVES